MKRSSTKVNCSSLDRPDTGQTHRDRNIGTEVLAQDTGNRDIGSETQVQSHRERGHRDKDIGTETQGTETQRRGHSI